jgi:glycosyltransferase involved in cell wall biosynthesis
MKVALLHTFYKQPGGEDAVFRDEAALLKRHGHDVIEITAHNEQMDSMSAIERLRVTIANSKAQNELLEVLEREKPEVLHVHNTFQYWSPEVFRTARRAGVPTVWTLHNYRSLCLNGLFYRDGKICEACLGKTFQYPGVLHRCYRGDRKASMVVAWMNAYHRQKGTFSQAVDAFICLTEFAQRKLAKGGLPLEKLHVKPNFVDPDPGMGNHEEPVGLFVGRLDAYKGILTLLNAWNHVRDLRLEIIGDGDLRIEVERRTGERIAYLGPKSPEEVIERMKRAKLLVFPSELYEGFPRVIVEAFATGLPVVVSDCGSAATIVASGLTGLHFVTGNPESLAHAINSLAYSGEYGNYSVRARQTYLNLYTGEANLARLLDIYAVVVQARR